MEKKPIDLGLTALDELFMTDEGRKESKLPRIHDIPLDQIDDMPNHPCRTTRQFLGTIAVKIRAQQPQLFLTPTRFLPILSS